MLRPREASGDAPRERDTLVDDEAGHGLSVVSAADLELALDVELVPVGAGDAPRGAEQVGQGGVVVALERERQVVGIAGVAGAERFGEAGEARIEEDIHEVREARAGGSSGREATIVCGEAA